MMLFTSAWFESTNEYASSLNIGSGRFFLVVMLGPGFFCSPSVGLVRFVSRSASSMPDGEASLFSVDEPVSSATVMSATAGTGGSSVAGASVFASLAFSNTQTKKPPVSWSWGTRRKLCISDPPHAYRFRTNHFSRPNCVALAGGHAEGGKGRFFSWSPPVSSIFL